MASPQCENGHTRIANELLEAVLRFGFTADEYAVILWAARQTYGWHRKAAPFTWYAVASDCGKHKGKGGLNVAGVWRAGRALIAANVLTATEGKIGLQKDFERWARPKTIDDRQRLPDLCSSSKAPLTTVYESVDDRQRFPDGLKIKEKKETLAHGSKGNSGTTQPEGFAEFWKAYPKRKDKQDALKAWRKLAPDAALRGVMLMALATQAQQPDWTKDSGQYVPYPAKWLRHRLWEDEIASSGGQHGSAEHVYA